MIRALRLKVGPPGAGPLTVELGRITVVVGPNQSGKSLLLGEIERVIEEDLTEGHLVGGIGPVIDDDSDQAAALLDVLADALEHLGEIAAALRIEGIPHFDAERAYIPRLFGWGELIHVDASALEGLIRAVPGLRFLMQPIRPESSNWLLRDIESTQKRIAIIAAYHMARLAAWRARGDWHAAAAEALAEGLVDRSAFAPFLRGRVMRISGADAGREVAESQPAEALGQETDSVPGILLDEEWRRELLEPYIGQTFGLYPVVDPTEMQSLTLALADRPPGPLVQSLGPAARAYLRAARPLGEFSAGVQSFVGLLALTIARPRPLLLVDEPETFLHPPLARRLGHFMASLAEQAGLQLIVATHSVDFLMGVAEVHAPTIVRLSHDGRGSAAWAMDAAALKAHLSKPLLRSSGILRALFARSTVICEGQSDQAVYEEIHRRAALAGGVYRDVVYFGANGKQNAPPLLSILRALGVPSAAILDWDVLHDASVRQRLWAAIGGEAEDPETGRRLEALAEASHQAARQSKGRGLRALDGDGQAEAREILRRLADRGAFVVPHGELESWLGDLALGPRKRGWAERALAKLEDLDDGAAPHLTRFIAQVESWFDERSAFDLAPLTPPATPGDDDMPAHLRPLLAAPEPGFMSPVEFFGIASMERAHNNALHAIFADPTWRRAFLPAVFRRAGWTDLLDGECRYDDPPQRQHRLPGGQVVDEYIVVRADGARVPLLIEIKLRDLGGVRQLGAYLESHGMEEGTPRGILLRLAFAPDPLPDPRIARLTLRDVIACLQEALNDRANEPPEGLARSIIADYRRMCEWLYEQELIFLRYPADVVALAKSHPDWWAENRFWVRNTLAGYVALVLGGVETTDHAPPAELAWLGPKIDVAPSGGPNTYIDCAVGLGAILHTAPDAHWIERSADGRALAAAFLKIRLWDDYITFEVHTIIASWETKDACPPDEMAAIGQLRSRLIALHGHLPSTWHKHPLRGRPRSSVVLSSRHPGYPEDLARLGQWVIEQIDELAAALRVTAASENAPR